MTRIVRQINFAPDRPEEGQPRLFAEFADCPNIVLLGDPGAGKSHLFRETAAAEGARLIKTRAFLVTPPTQLSGQSLYIDGLDERRAGRGDRDTVDAIAEKLFAVDPPRVRISCRAADWLGESDLAGLRPYFEQHGDPPVLLLQNLSEEEQIAVLSGEGIDRATAANFLSEADEHGLDDFLRNPQNLLMLWRAVKTGSWPKSRTELFELATELMLQEFDPGRARAGTGSYSVAELRPVAGAICAARLISDVDAISLTEQEGTNEIPSFRSLTFFDLQMTQATLGRRIFVAGPELETVDYAHRTTAEFLGASFLAAQIREGLPFGRVLALIGVDGHPTPELRGLHAWLAVHLPEKADQLVESDPYGVLTYGDAASLPPSVCARLVQSLDRLSKQNPWFWSGDWQSLPIGALARPDMVAEFREVLDNPEAGFGVRSVIVEALSLGTPIPEMLPDLRTIVTRPASYYAERSRALDALHRLGNPGKAAILESYPKLGKSTNELRLRTQIITAYYGDPFRPDDVLTMVADTLDAGEEIPIGMLYALADRIPEVDLPVLLDGMKAPEASQSAYDWASWEVRSFYPRILVRIWRSLDAFDASRALDWFRKRAAIMGGTSERGAQALSEAMVAMPERLRAIADHFFTALVADDDPWREFQEFRRALLSQPNPEQLRAIVMEHLDAEADETAKQAFLYELAFAHCHGTEEPGAEAAFEKLYELGEAKPNLREIRERALRCDLPVNYFQGMTRREQEAEDGRERQRREFAEQIDLICAGKHLGWVTHLARLYFGLYSNIDQTLTPHQRLAAWLGTLNLEPALKGLRAALVREDLPNLADVISLAKTHKRYDWWYGLVAGLDERWSTGEGFGGLSEDQIKALVAFDLMNSVYLSIDGVDQCVVHPWVNALLEENPELMRDVYCAVARSCLEREEQFVHGLTELLADGPLEPFRKDILLEFLRGFPNANPLHLDQLLNTLMTTPGAHAQFFDLAPAMLSDGAPLDQRQRDMWLVTAYLLSPVAYEEAIEQRALAHPHVIFDLRNRSRFGFRGKPNESLSLRILEFMARLTGTSFGSTSHPTGGRRGDTNAWEASEYFRTLIGKISAMPSEVATDALKRFAADPAFASYEEDILSALANQMQRRRDADYDRPDWSETVAALSNGPPATVAELHALLFEHIHDLKRRIERTNTDIWKRFWNIDSSAKPVNPRPEEACRDELVEMMRSHLYPLEINVEPEGHMAGDKRADISVAMPGRKILCELKRDYHADVWRAIQEQLERFYVHDPEANGFGVYCVFWFGQNRVRPIPKPPGGGPRPVSAVEMGNMLRDLMPENMQSRIAVIVIDVSGEF